MRVLLPLSLGVVCLTACQSLAPAQKASLHRAHDRYALARPGMTRSQAGTAFGAPQSAADGQPARWQTAIDACNYERLTLDFDHRGRSQKVTWEDSRGQALPFYQHRKGRVWEATQRSPRTLVRRDSSFKFGFPLPTTAPAADATAP